jgi:hypothetical protein
MIHFATCERGRALGFLKVLYPSKEITDTKECAADFLDFVEKDIVRVQDPAMHGNGTRVITGKNFDDSLSDKIKEAINKFHN